MSIVFDEYKKEVDESVRKTLSRIQVVKKVKYTSANNPIEILESNIRKLAKDLWNISGASIQNVKLITAPNEINADYTIAMFLLAKDTHKNPSILAKELSKKIISEHTDIISNINIAGPYINISLNQNQLYSELLTYFYRIGEHFGKSNINSNKTVLIDFSSPNIAKPLGIGHLRSTIIGHALANIYEWTGFGVIRDNHLGDWGTQFGELIYAYQHWGNKDAVEKNPIHELKNLYVKFHEELKTNPSLKTESRRIFNELEKGNNELLGLWKKFRDLSIVDFQKIYSRLNVDFDTYIGESFFANQTDAVIQECVTNGICKKDPNSDVVFVDSLKNLPSFIMRKQDGSSLYITRDLATMHYRIKTFAPNIILYVVGSEQSLNFNQLFELAKEIKYLPEGVVAEHISFGMVLRDGKKMSTRRGTIVELEEVIDKAAEKAKEILTANNPNLNKKETSTIADIVGIGAILYNDLQQSRTRNLSFDWDRMLKFEAGSSTYLQYAYVRIQSIMAKATEKMSALTGVENTNFVFENKKEFDLAKKIGQFPQIIILAQQTNAPHLICTYLEELSQQFNSFYSDVPIINTDDNQLFLSRITLIKAVATTLRNGLTVLGIKLPAKM